MNIDFKTLKTEMLATPDDEARAIKLADLAGNPYGQITWIWIDDALNVNASKLPNGYEGQTLGVEDMLALSIAASGKDEREAQAQDMALQLMLWGAGVPSSPNEGGAGKPVIAPVSVEVKTERGVALAKISCEDGFIHIHVTCADHQPPFFVVLDESMANKVIATIKKLVECADLPSSVNTTDEVESGALSADHSN